MVFSLHLCRHFVVVILKQNLLIHWWKEKIYVWRLCRAARRFTLSAYRRRSHNGSSPHSLLLKGFEVELAGMKRYEFSQLLEKRHIPRHYGLPDTCPTSLSLRRGRRVALAQARQAGRSRSGEAGGQDLPRWNKNKKWIHWAPHSGIYASLRQAGCTG